MVFALLLAGCAKPQSVQSASLVANATISGVVTEASLEPIAGATVRVDATNVSAKTDATGAFRLTVPPGEWIVLASAPAHMGGALRAHADPGSSVKLAFQLPGVPTVAPHVSVVETHGLISCAGGVKNANQTTTYSCGTSDPNERTELKVPIPNTDALAGAVLELVWTPTSSASKNLGLQVAVRGAGPDDVELAEDEGGGHITIVAGADVILADLGTATSGDLVAHVAPAGSMTDEEAALDAGLAVQQPFTLYASFFYNAPPTPGYTVVKSG